MENLFKILFIAVILCSSLLSTAQPRFQGNELIFPDNGQIRSSDNNHVILFRRSENILDFREYGDIVFFSGYRGVQTSTLFLAGSGNVGIGTNSPIYTLQVRKDQNTATKINVENLENNVSSAAAMTVLANGTGLDVFAFSQANTGTLMEGLPRAKTVQFRTHAGANAERLIFGTGSASPIHFFTDDVTRLYIGADGNIGIGTIATGTAKLAVDGKIASTEVKVEIAPGQGPDYVFLDDYELRTLPETKQYIKDNQHLPEIPSALEMEKNGIELAEMNMKLLKKIEELTLYQIELLERLESAETRISDLESGQ